MAGRIRDEDIALVRERSAIEEVVGEYLQLRNAGAGSLKALCPFHDEKTPSFTVSAARNVYYCHGCGAGGDAIRFVIETERLSFVESVERLAGRVGIQLRYIEAGPAPVRQQGQRQREVAAVILPQRGGADTHAPGQLARRSRAQLEPGQQSGQRVGRASV